MEKGTILIKNRAGVINEVSEEQARHMLKFKEGELVEGTLEDVEVAESVKDSKQEEVAEETPVVEEVK